MKESVFYPCGHRCTCYKCALYLFKLYEKCPKQNCKQIEAIVPKIYEIFNENNDNNVENGEKIKKNG